MSGNSCNTNKKCRNWNGYRTNSKLSGSTSASDSSADIVTTELLSNQEACAGGEGDRDATQHFEAFKPTSYLERQVEKLGLDDEHDAIGVVTDELRERHKRAERKREDHVKRIVNSNTERIKRIEKVHADVKHQEEKKKNSIHDRHVEKLNTAQRRRQHSLDSITQARKSYHHKVKRKRNNSMDLSDSLSTEGRSLLERKLEMADRRRKEIRFARKRRSQECQNGAKAQFAMNRNASFMGICDGITSRGRDDDCLGHRFLDEKGVHSIEEQHAYSVSVVLSRLRTKARKTRPNTLTKRLWGVRVIQEWWRCMVDGVPYEGIGDELLDMETSLSFSLPGYSSLSSVKSSSISLKSSPVLLTETEDSCKGSAESVDTLQSFNMTFPSLEGEQMIKYYSEDAAARTIQRFFLRCRHDLKVVNGLIQCAPSIRYVCGKIREMETASFDEGMQIMKDAGLLTHMENTLRALRMGKEIKHVSSGVRSARAFICSILINSYPTSSLDDYGTLSNGSSINNEVLELKKEKLLESSGEVIVAMLILEEAVNKVIKTENNDNGGAATKGGGDGGEIMTPYATNLILKASKKVMYTRLTFCRRFDAWKRLDSIRLTEELTSTCVDVLLMQLRAERDLRIAASRLGLEDAMMDDDDNLEEDAPCLSTGFRQIKEGTQRQLGQMFAALIRLVGREEARFHMAQVSEAAFRRLQLDEIEDDGGDADDTSLPSQIYDRAASAASESGGRGSQTLGGTCATGASSLYETGTEDNSMDGSERKVGITHTLTAGDLLSNEWLVHEVLVSQDPVTVNLEQAEEKGLLPNYESLGIDDMFWEEASEAFKECDYTPLIMLISDLRMKIIGFTPKRKDLAIETCEAMDVDLLKQMNKHGALDINTFFKVIRFACERVLELEAPIRNAETSAKLEALSEARSSIAIGRMTFDIELVREYFTFLYSKLGEIHVDILNAHLQFVTPFLKQHGVEYEKDRFIEKLDTNEINLDATYSWLNSAICSLRDKNTCLPEERNDPKRVKEAYDAQKLLDGLEAQQGDAYLKVVRMAVVDNLLGLMVSLGGPPSVTKGGGGEDHDESSSSRTTTTTAAAAAAAAAVSSSRGKYLCSKGKRMEKFTRYDECNPAGVRLPETLHLDR